MPVKTGVRGGQQVAAEQKIQCERGGSHTLGLHCSQRATHDLYKWPGPIWATAANNSATQRSMNREEDSEMKKENTAQKDPSLNTLLES